METNYESEWGSCQSRVCRMGVGGNRSTSQSSGTVVMSNDGASRDVSQRTDDHGKREPSQSSEVPPCRLSCFWGKPWGNQCEVLTFWSISSGHISSTPLLCTPISRCQVR